MQGSIILLGIISLVAQACFGLSAWVLYKQRPTPLSAVGMVCGVITIMMALEQILQMFGAQVQLVSFLAELVGVMGYSIFAVLVSLGMGVAILVGVVERN